MVSAVSSAPSRYSCPAVPHRLSLWVHPRTLQVPFRVHRSWPADGLLALALDMPSTGSRSSSRYQLAPSTTPTRLPSPSFASFPQLASFRPRRFSRPRRFPPPPALRVYFTPQPRPGFTLQGFSPSASMTGSSPAIALLSFAPAPCRLRFNSSAPGTVARLQGFHPAEDPSRSDGGLAHPTARSPHELHLPRVLLCEP